MSLNEILLQKLAEWQPPATGRNTFTAAEEPTGWQLILTADRWDDLSCLAWELTVRKANALAGGAAALQNWADRIANRAVGVMEPLKVLEVDPSRNEAILRSSEPRRRGDQLFYFEVLLKGTGEAMVRRYQGARPGGVKREQVAFAVTHEALADLVARLTAE